MSCDALIATHGEWFVYSSIFIYRCQSILSLLPSLKNCPRCDDMLETHCKWFYRLFILLQDEKGNEFVVSLSGKEVCVSNASLELYTECCMLVHGVAGC